MDSQKMKAAYGAKDDRVMALGFALFSMDVERIRRPRYNLNQPLSLMPEQIDSSERMEGAYPVWQPSSQASSVSTGRAHAVVRTAHGRMTLGQLLPRSGGGW